MIDDIIIIAVPVEADQSVFENIKQYIYNLSDKQFDHTDIGICWNCDNTLDIDTDLCEIEYDLVTLERELKSIIDN